MLKLSLLKKNSLPRTRIYLYINTVLLLIFVYVLIQQWPWNSLIPWKKAMDILSMTLATIVGLLALVRFYSRREFIFLFVGVGFLGAGILDSYNVFSDSTFFNAYFKQPSPFLSEWSWLSSRFFLAVFMALSAWVASRKRETIAFLNLFSLWLYFLAALFIVLSVLAFTFFNFPPPYLPERFLSQPLEWIPAGLFLMAVVGYLKKRPWKGVIFEHWLLLSLLVSFMAQLLFTPFSFYSNISFEVAQLLKSVSYAFVFIGLLMSMSHLFKELEKNRSALKEKNFKLIQAKKKAELALKKAKEKAKSLKNSKVAMLNIMDDLNQEKIELAKAKAKDEAILQNIGEGLIVTDLKEKVQIMNEAALKIIGLKEADVIGKNWIKVIGPVNEDGQKMNPKKLPLYHALKKRQPVFQRDLFYVKKSGERFPVAITASPIFFRGKKTGGILVFRDITHEKEVEKTKTEFVSFASHQLRTPLATINWYTEMILDGDVGRLKPQQKEYLQEVYASCQRMVKLVNDILNVSRLELGTFMIDPEKIDLKQIAQEVLKELESKIHEKKAKILTDYDKSLPSLKMDEKLTHMIFLNLLSNAVKYSPEKTEVTLRIKKKESHVLIEVKDNGYGIPKAQQPKVFGKLFRADNVKAMEIEGTGFGLYMIKTIVEKSGGRIWFESKENKGTVFYVEFPLKGMVSKKGAKTLS